MASKITTNSTENNLNNSSLPKLRYDCQKYVDICTVDLADTQFKFSIQFLPLIIVAIG